jgi:hypothetical protein
MHRDIRKYLRNYHSPEPEPGGVYMRTGAVHCALTTSSSHQAASMHPTPAASLNLAPTRADQGIHLADVRLDHGCLDTGVRQGPAGLVEVPTDDHPRGRS